MINKITNWTFGSLFRTIGRIIAYAIIGLLIFLFSNGKIKALQIGNRNFPDFPSNYTNFAIWYNDSGWNNELYYGYTSNENFYVLCHEFYSSSNNRFKSCQVFNNRLEVSESVYNNSSSSTRIYINNKYYVFTPSSSSEVDYINAYSLDARNSSNNWTSISSYYMSYAYPFASYGVDFYINREDTTGENEIISSPYNVSNYNVRFHLNGGKMCKDTSNTSFTTGNTGAGCHYEDFTVSFPSMQLLLNYNDNYKKTKDTMIFQGWYYDINFLDPLNITDELTSDIDLYAKFDYVDLYNSLQNITFNEYIFPDDKNFAVLNVTSNYNKAFIGTEYNFTTLSVFQYNLDTSSFYDNAVYNLQSIGFINQYYYYSFNDITSGNIKIAIISKDQLQGISSTGNLLTYNKFIASDNINVTFTNDLSSITVYDTSNNEYQLNASDVFYNNYNIIKNSNDITSMLKQLANQRNKGIFGNFITIWNALKLTPLTAYITLIFVCSIIIFILKVWGRR